MFAWRHGTMITLTATNCDQICHIWNYQHKSKSWFQKVWLHNFYLLWVWRDTWLQVSEGDESLEPRATMPSAKNQMKWFTCWFAFVHRCSCPCIGGNAVARSNFTGIRGPMVTHGDPWQNFWGQWLDDRVPPGPPPTLQLPQKAAPISVVLQWGCQRGVNCWSCQLRSHMTVEVTLPWTIGIIWNNRFSIYRANKWSIACKTMMLRSQDIRSLIFEDMLWLWHV